MKSKRGSPMFAGAVVVSLLLAGCAAPPEQARSVFREQMLLNGYQPFDPIRVGVGVGSIITYGKDGREIPVADPGECFPSLATEPPKKHSVALFSDKYERVNAGGLAASASKLTESVANFDFALDVNSEIQAEMKFVKPYNQYASALTMESMLADLKKRSEKCYAAAMDSNNVVIFNIIGAGGAEYVFKDKTNSGVKLSASLFEKAKVAPELRRKTDGQSSLIIDQDMPLGYRVVEFRKGAGMVSDTTTVRELSLEKLTAFRRVVRDSKL